MRFIDLPFASQTLVDQSDRLTGRTATLLGEHWFRRSAYLRRLAGSLGCRDVDELWDRLFESWGPYSDTQGFAAQLASYCDLARDGVTDEEHEHDGTAARESEMAWHVSKAIGEGSARPLVVTGGYHTVALPDLVEKSVARPVVDVAAIEASGSVLVRYSFDRLDRANGYGAGMPAPAFYQRVWDAAGREVEVPLAMLMDIAYRSREQGIDTSPTTVAISAALEQARRLATIRGNRAPTRADVADAIGTCFLEGAGMEDSRPLAQVVRGVFTGNAIGQVPASAGLPPIVTDFYTESRKSRLKVDDTDVRQIALDVYADERSRAVSRLLHRLDFLEVPFASRLAGPSLTGRTAGRRLREVWRYGWTPQTESALVDAAAYGSTLEEAAAQRFADIVSAPATIDASQRSASSAARQLAQACLLGLHAQAGMVVERLRGAVREDPSFESVVAATHHLTLLWQAREPLEASGLEEVPTLARAAFDRATYLTTDLPHTPLTAAHAVARSLVGLREVLVGQVASWFDAEVLWGAVQSLAARREGEASIIGAAAGMLYAADRLSENEIAALIGNFAPLGSTGERGVAFIRGLLLGARELVWQSAAVLAALRAQIEGPDEAEYVRRLPDLRLALSVLTPAETDSLAEIVAGALGVGELKAAITYDVSAEEVQRNLEWSLELREVLERDGLHSWLTSQVSPPP